LAVLKPIKVVDIFNTDYGAYRLLRTRILKIDSDERFKNYLICPSGKWAEKMKKQGVKVIDIDMDRSIHPFSTIKDIRNIRRILKEIKPHIIHTHNSKPGVVGRVAAKQAGIPVIIHQVHGYHFIHLNGFKRKFYETIEKLMARFFTDVLLFQNHDEYQYSLTNRFNKRCKLEFIGNGIPIEEFLDYINKEKKLKKDSLIISCVARLEPVKNHIMLFKGVRLLKDKGINIQVRLIGEGFLKEKLKKMCDDLEIRDLVVFVGTLDRPEVIKEIFDSDFAVLTSLKEGKPRFLMEASLLGTPIIATDVVGTRDVVKNEINGFLISLNDIEALANTIIDLIENPKKWSKISFLARKYALEKFDENNVVDKIKDIYIREVAKWQKKLR